MAKTLKVFGAGRETKMKKIPRTSLLSSELLKATFLGTFIILVSHAWITPGVTTIIGWGLVKHP